MKENLSINKEDFNSKKNVSLNFEELETELKTFL